MFSILITSYECHGKGVDLLRENLMTVFSQTYRPLQCIVSDHSRDNIIEDMVKTLDTNGVDLVFVKYSENYGNPCHNWNNALEHCVGEYIQYLAMDERYYYDNAIQDIVKFMKISNAKWIACSQLIYPINTKFTPRWNDNILQCNTISGPAAVILDKSLKHIKLDPGFIWYLDLDWYYRIYLEVGPPLIYDNITYIGRIHEFQLSNTICSNTEFQEAERSALIVKYGKPLPSSP